MKASFSAFSLEQLPHIIGSILFIPLGETYNTAIDRSSCGNRFNSLIEWLIVTAQYIQREGQTPVLV